VNLLSNVGLGSGFLFRPAITVNICRVRATQW